MKSTFSFLILIVLLIPGPLSAQDHSDAINQFRRTVYTLQQELLELKEKYDRQEREITAQRERLSLETERLREENKDLRTRIQEMDSLLFQFEERLRSSAVVKLSKELESLQHLSEAILLESVENKELSEKLILDIINQPDSSIPKDLLILYLARCKKDQKDFEESLSYYSTLLSEFTNSMFFSQGIFEMAQVLGDMGKKEQRTMLLIQLSGLSETDRYSQKATEELRKMGEGSLFEDAASDTTADNQVGDLIHDTTADNQVGDFIHDTTADIQLDEVSSDVTADLQTGRGIYDSTADIHIDEAAVDLTSDIQTGVIEDDSTSDLQMEEAALDSTSDLQMDEAAVDLTSDILKGDSFQDDTGDLSVPSDPGDGFIPSPFISPDTTADISDTTGDSLKAVPAPGKVMKDDALDTAPVKKENGVPLIEDNASSTLEMDATGDAELLIGGSDTDVQLGDAGQIDQQQVQQDDAEQNRTTEKEESPASPGSSL